jgi:hypothetical protein
MGVSKKAFSPNQILTELRQIKEEISAEKLTSEGKQAILVEVDKIEALLLELKSVVESPKA